MENLMEKYNDLYSRIELVFGDDYEEQFGEKIRVNEKRMKECVQKETQRINTLKYAEIMAKEAKESCQNADILKKFNERIFLVNHMFDEIEQRAKDLSKKCNALIKNLKDGQIFEKSKEVKSIEIEFNIVVDKITELVKGVPERYDTECEILNKVCKIRSEMWERKNDYKTKLQYEVSDRDISMEKLQNASILK